MLKVADWLSSDLVLLLMVDIELWKALMASFRLFSAVAVLFASAVCFVNLSCCAATALVARFFAVTIGSYCGAVITFAMPDS
ncbi:hypothetical protein D3C85_238380 [compost metagenome]